MMKRMGSYLKRHHYQVQYWGYSSLRKGIPEQAITLRRYLLSLLKRRERIDVVAHSMGAILFRAATHDLPELDSFRVVMLGPPNDGSKVAAALAKRLGFLSPALGQLSDEEGSFVQTLPKRVPVETGIVAAARDHVISLSSVWLPDVQEREIVDCRHGLLPYDSRACLLVKNFLNHGTFENCAAAAHCQ